MGRPRITSGASTSAAPKPSHRAVTTCSNTPTLVDDAQSHSNLNFDLLDKGIGGRDGNASLSAWLADNSPDFSLQTDSMFTEPFAQENSSHSNLTDTLEAVPLRSLREKYLHTLSALNEDLLKQVYAMNSEESPNMATTLSGSTDQQQESVDSDSQNNLVGKILSNSQRFLDIMQPFLVSSQTQPATAPLFAPNPFTFGSHGLSLQASPLTTDARTLDFEEAFTSADPLRARTLSMADFSISTPTRQSSGDVLRPDFPTAMTFMSCFCSLNRIYRIMFSRIESALMNSNSSGAQLRAILPSVNLDGFGIEQHHELQINVLLQVSTDMLDRMESTIELLLVGREGRGLFPASLFQLLMQQEALGDDPHDGGSAAMTLKAKIRNMKRLLEVGVS